jgi:Carboxypeptidase regulatory-like domain
MQGGDYRTRFQFIHIFYDRRRLCQFICYRPRLVHRHTLLKLSKPVQCQVDLIGRYFRGIGLRPRSQNDKVLTTPHEIHPWTCRCSNCWKGGVMVNRRLLAGILVAIAFANCSLFGQGFSAAISGTVRDTTGAVLPGVSITATNTESGLMRTVVSNETGSYNFQSLPVGPYELTTDLPGFKQQVRRGITLVMWSGSCSESDTGSRSAF